MLAVPPNLKQASPHRHKKATRTWKLDGNLLALHRLLIMPYTWVFTLGCNLIAF